MSDPVLSLENLEVTYRTRTEDVHAVRDVSFELESGQVLALVGESGSGKSTSAHAILGLLPEGGRVTDGRIEFAGRTLATAADFQSVRGIQIGLVPQDPGVALNPVVRVGEQVVEVLLIHKLASGQNARDRAVELLGEAGLPDPDRISRMYPHQLSGGMRQRVLIAIALATRPQLVIADEPTSALDVTVQKQVLDHFETLIHEFGTTVLLITHDLGVAADRADSIVVLSDGYVVESGSVDLVLKRPETEYTSRLISSAPGLHIFTNEGSSTSSDAQSRFTGSQASSAAQSPLLLSLRQVRREFRSPALVGGGAGGQIVAVDNVDLDIFEGDSFGLVGESGSGKTTLARLALRLESPTNGTITFDGHDITNLSQHELRPYRRRMQFIYQNPFASLDPRYTIERVIEEPLRAFHVGNKESRSKKVDELLDHVALPSALRRRKPGELSGGQRQRVAIARALALEPELLVCDEPVSALDVTVQAQILELLSRLRSELGLSYLFISHDLAVVGEVCERVGVMHRGLLLEVGLTRDVFRNPSQLYTQELLSAIAGRRATAAAATHERPGAGTVGLIP